jgi:hypothetical protein
MAERISHFEERFSSGHRLSVCGNVVGRSICRSPLVDLLSHWSRRLCLWTWEPGPGGIHLRPCYGKGPDLVSSRGRLKALLHHLPWQDSGEREELAELKALRRGPAEHPTQG